MFNSDQMERQIARITHRGLADTIEATFPSATTDEKLRIYLQILQILAISQGWTLRREFAHSEDE